MTIRATDRERLFVEQIISVTLPDLPAPSVAQAGEIVINRRTGLFEQKITITNSAQRAIGGFDLVVAGLSVGHELYGIDGNSISRRAPMAAGETLNLTLEYFASATRSAPTPHLTVSAVLPAPVISAEPSQTGPARVSSLADGVILLEFSSNPGRRYRVQYSLDMMTWLDSPVVITANANRTPWLDQGLPKTNCHPRDCTMRIYRLLELAENPNN